MIFAKYKYFTEYKDFISFYNFQDTECVKASYKKYLQLSSIRYLILCIYVEIIQTSQHPIFVKMTDM